MGYTRVDGDWLGPMLGRSELDLSRLCPEHFDADIQIWDDLRVEGRMCTAVVMSNRYPERLTVAA